MGSCRLRMGWNWGVMGIVSGPVLTLFAALDNGDPMALTSRSWLDQETLSIDSLRFRVGDEKGVDFTCCLSPRRREVANFGAIGMVNRGVAVGLLIGGVEDLSPFPNMLVLEARESLSFGGAFLLIEVKR